MLFLDVVIRYLSRNSDRNFVSDGSCSHVVCVNGRRSGNGSITVCKFKEHGIFPFEALWQVFNVVGVVRSENGQRQR